MVCPGLTDFSTQALQAEHQHLGGRHAAHGLAAIDRQLPGVQVLVQFATRELRAVLELHLLGRRLGRGCWSFAGVFAARHQLSALLL